MSKTLRITKFRNFLENKDIPIINTNIFYRLNVKYINILK